MRGNRDPEAPLKVRRATDVIRVQMRQYYFSHAPAL
jgi:hypothetical protein